MLSMLRSQAKSTISPHQFNELMNSTYKQAYSVAYRLTGNAADAEDLVQDAYLRAFRFIHRYDDSLPFISWLYRILANAHIDMIRRKRNHRHASLDSSGLEGQQAMEIADDALCPEVLVMRDHLTDEVEIGMKQMNPEFRMAVILADIEGLSYEEIAEIMETSVGTVRSRIHRGRLQLRSFLQQNFPSRFGGAHVL
jgi:RNA polymerase sigma-70 factor, ECF subfamily